MDNKKKQEIPFGAFDSELMHQEINIPEGFEAEIKGDKIILKKTDSKVRKAMIDFFKSEREEGITVLHYGVNIEHMIAWLEKQGTSYTKSDVDDAYLKGIRDTKNELEKQGEQKPQRMISAEAKEAMYGKPAYAWSEEDEVMIKVFDSIIRYIVEVVDKDALERFGTNREELFSWLKSLRPQPKQEWSEEDEEYINDLIGVFDGQQYQAHSDEEIVKWLKSIRLPYNKEWDENDEEMLRSIIATCELAEQDRDSSPARHLLEMQLNWLKSLKQRIGDKL